MIKQGKMFNRNLFLSIVDAIFFIRFSQKVLAYEPGCPLSLLMYWSLGIGQC